MSSSEYAIDVIKSFIPEAVKSTARDLRESFRRLRSPQYYLNSVDSSARIEGVVLGGHVFIGEKSFVVGDVQIGKYTTLNSECRITGGPVTIGNYCQLGPRVAIYTVNHSMGILTTYNNHLLFGGALKQRVEDKEVKIGHDVWLGHGVLIMPGVTLGTGCVVGAGAVVTKEFPPYAVVAGCPARLVRFRLPESCIKTLLNSHWWCLDPDELADFRDVFMLPPQKVPADRLEALTKLGKAKACSLGE